MLEASFAYLLWVAGYMLGFPGFHRLYMKKYNVGTALRFIPGLGHVLAIVDLFTIPSQINEINLQTKYQRAIGGRWAKLPSGTDSVERVILRTAKKNKGIVTPGEVALEGDLSIQEAKKNLDELASKGFTELRVKKSGVLVYTFPEFMDHGEDEQLLDI